jgi:hypothetical protein
MTVHYSLRCKICESPMRLPIDTRPQQSAVPEGQPNDFPPIAVECGRCKSICSYVVHRKFVSSDPKAGSVVTESRPTDAVPAITLECGVEGCTSLLPLYVHWSTTTTVAERKADMQTWRWENLRCPQGHPISKLES